MKESDVVAMDLAADDKGSLSIEISGFNSDGDKDDEGPGDDKVDESGSGKDLGSVDAEVTELVPGKETCVPTMHFGRSLMTEKCIELYVDNEFFPKGVGRAPRDEVVPKPKYGEVVVFKHFFTAGLRFPCDPVLPAILDHFRAKLHHLIPNSFVALSKIF